MAAPKVIFLWRLRTLGVRDGAIGSPSLSPRPGRNLGPVVRNEPHLGVSVLPPWGWPRCGRAGKFISPHLSVYPNTPFPSPSTIRAHHKRGWAFHWPVRRPDGWPRTERDPS